MIKNRRILSNSTISIILNILTIVYVALFLGFWFEENDDVAMSQLAYNGCGYIVFQNMLLGYLYKILFHLYKGLNWYSLFFCAVIFFSGYLIEKSILDIVKNKKVGIFACICFSGFFMADMYNQMQFTKTSACLMIAGITYLYKIKIIETKKHILKTILAVSMIIIGSMIRFDCIYICGVYAGMVLLLYFHDFFDADDKAEYIKNKSDLIIIFIIAFASCFALRIVDKTFAKVNYGEYVETNSARSNVLDHSRHNYTEIQAEMDTIGISENDYNMLYEWMISDPEFFTAEKFDQIEKIAVKKQQPIQLLDEFQHTVFYPIFIICVVMVCSLIFFGYRKKKHFVFWAISFLGAVFLYGVLLLVANRLVYRVEFCVWMLVFVFCTLVASDDVKVNWKKILPIALIILLMFVRGCRITRANQNYDRAEMTEEITECEKYVNSHKENIYFTTTYATYILKPHIIHSIFDTSYFDSENIVALGGWDYMHPQTIKQWNGYGITNPFKDMVNMDNAYLIANEGHFDLIITYLHEHYFDNILYEQVESIGSVNVYKIQQNGAE